MISDEIILKVENVSKIYKLGEIGGTTLRDELQRLKARILHKEDPTKRIGSKSYNKGEKFKALDNISFEVKKGERIGIIGHNGAGKSTLLKLISRVTGPSDGKIYLNGRVASMLEVGTGFHPELTGRENIYMNGAILGMTKREIDAKMEDIIEFSEVRQFIDTPVKRYSSGMYVKLAFSVAAHLDSEIVIMDEVLAVGDVAFQNKCINKMRTISEQENKTILYVSHNMSTIRQLCDKIMVLDHGKLVFCGDTETGISIYNGNIRNKKKHYDFANIERLKNYSNSICLKTLDILNDNYDLNQGDKLILKLSFDINKPTKHVIFRIIFYSGFFEPLATVYAKESNFDKVGLFWRTLKIDTSQFSPGLYSARITIYTDDGNSTIIHDSIHEAFFFEVYSNEEWISNHWGNFLLPEATEE